MSNVRHHLIDCAIRVHELPEDAFHRSMNEVIEGILGTAHALGETVDWSTFRVEPGDKMEILQGDGTRFFYEDPLRVTVDCVKIEEAQE